MAVKRKTIDLGKSMQEFDERIEAQRANTPSILETLAPIEEHPKKKEVKQRDRTGHLPPGNGKNPRKHR